MPLWQIFHPVDAYTADDKKAFSERITSLYAQIPIPKIYVVALFIPVPEGKTAKNRMHLDLAPDRGTRDEAVEVAVAAGATVVGDHRRPDGAGWVVLQDPEGNEFCIERGREEARPPKPREFRIGA